MAIHPAPSLCTSTRALLADCAETRDELRAAKEQMQATLSAARAGLQTANDDRCVRKSAFPGKAGRGASQEPVRAALIQAAEATGMLEFLTPRDEVQHFKDAWERARAQRRCAQDRVTSAYSKFVADTGPGPTTSEVARLRICMAIESEAAHRYVLLLERSLRS